MNSKQFHCIPNCPDRHPGDETRPNCHTICPHGYAEWSRQHNQELTEHWLSNYPISEMEAHKADAVLRAKKKWRRRHV